MPTAPAAGARRRGGLRPTCGDEARVNAGRRGPVGEGRIAPDCRSDRPGRRAEARPPPAPVSPPDSPQSCRRPAASRTAPHSPAAPPRPQPARHHWPPAACLPRPIGPRARPSRQPASSVSHKRREASGRPSLSPSYATSPRSPLAVHRPFPEIIGPCTRPSRSPALPSFPPHTVAKILTASPLAIAIGHSPPAFPEPLVCLHVSQH